MTRAMICVLALTGCTTWRQAGKASELTGCEREHFHRVAHQEHAAEFAREATPELSWYQGCAQTVVCGPAFEPECWRLARGADLRPASEERSSVVVERGVTLGLRPQRLYRVEGMTHQQTYDRQAVLLGRRESQVAAKKQITSSCFDFLRGMGSLGQLWLALWPILLPVGAIGVVGTGICLIAVDTSGPDAAIKGIDEQLQRLGQQPLLLADPAEMEHAVIRTSGEN